MSGQPEAFDFAKIIPTEIPLGVLTPPMAIVKAGDSLTLRVTSILVALAQIALLYPLPGCSECCGYILL